MTRICVLGGERGFRLFFGFVEPRVRAGAGDRPFRTGSRRSENQEHNYRRLRKMLHRLTPQMQGGNSSWGLGVAPSPTDETKDNLGRRLFELPRYL